MSTLGTTLEHHNIVIDDVSVHYVASEPNGSKKTIEKVEQSAKPSKPTLVFLHGFPEYWHTWRAQLDFFSTNYRVIAPDLPGYNLSDKPQNTAFFEVSNLITFMVNFIKNVCPSEKVILVAHDWGGAIAWPLTAFYPQYIEKLIILNAAHPSTFTREMINNPQQRAKSAYIHELISAKAETLLCANNFQYLISKMMMSSNLVNFSEEVKESYRQVWRQPGAVNGMLQYYRAMPQLAEEPSTENTAQNLITQHTPIKSIKAMKIPNIRIEVPTLILWGEQDQAFVNENLDGIENYVADCKIIRFPNTSHWLMHEKSPEINIAISEFIEVN